VARGTSVDGGVNIAQRGEAAHRRRAGQAPQERPSSVLFGYSELSGMHRVGINRSEQQNLK
jgi:hypothetical protein